MASRQTRIKPCRTATVGRYGWTASFPIDAGQSDSGLNVRAVARPSVDANAMGRVLAKLARELDKQDRNAA